MYCFFWFVFFSVCFATVVHLIYVLFCVELEFIFTFINERQGHIPKPNCSKQENKKKQLEMEREFLPKCFNVQKNHRKHATYINFQEITLIKMPAKEANTHKLSIEWRKHLPPFLCVQNECKRSQNGKL